MKKICMMFLLLSIVFCSLNAAIYKKTKLSHLINTSSTIVKGEVVGVYTYWKTDGKKNIFRDVTIEIESTVKGEVKSSITVSLMGGEMDGLTQEIDDVPDLQVGDQGIFFLVNHKNKTWIHSMALGYYQIFEQEFTGEKLVYNKFEQTVIEFDISVLSNVKNTLLKKHKLNEFMNEINGYVNKGEEK